MLLVVPWLVSGATQGAARNTSAAPPPSLSALVSKAGLEGAIAAWCTGELRPGRLGGFAVAVSGSGAGGRYVALDTGGTAWELATYTGRPEVSCYSRAEARRLDQAIRQSRTIHGEVTPRWSAAVICGFVEETRAVCWQRPPAGGAFVSVGGWVT